MRFVQPDRIFYLAAKTFFLRQRKAAGTSSGVRNKIEVLGGAPDSGVDLKRESTETTYGTRQRFKTISVSRNIFSCLEGTSAAAKN